MISINNVDILVIIIFNNRVFWDRKKSVAFITLRKESTISMISIDSNVIQILRIHDFLNSSKYINIAQNIENCCKINCFY